MDVSVTKTLAGELPQYFFGNMTNFWDSQEVDETNKYALVT